MSLAVVLSRGLAGLDAPLVTVEVHLAGGLPAFNLVGLPDTEVKESRDRVRAALQNAQFEFPARKITVNLAPADLPKESGRFDLPIAIGILAATGQIPAQRARALRIRRRARAGRCAARRFAARCRWRCRARRDGRAFVLPARERRRGGARARCARAIRRRRCSRCARILTGREPIAAASARTVSAVDASALRRSRRRARPGASEASADHRCGRRAQPADDRSAGHGQVDARAAPAGTPAAAVRGRSARERGDRLARRPVLVRPSGDARPFRAPHHTASAVALVGGGSDPRPGEISLAHHGVLFLDELPEWDRRVLEVLREPLESGVIHISRAARQSTFPAEFQFIAAMNPCPCGWLGHASGRCHCTPDRIARYRSRISGPLHRPHRSRHRGARARRRRRWRCGGAPPSAIATGDERARTCAR